MLCLDPINRPARRHDVDLARSVLAERQDRPDVGDPPHPLFGRHAIDVVERSEKPGAIVAVEVSADEDRCELAAVHHAADHRATIVVAVLERRLDQSVLRAERHPVAVRALHRAPAIVEAGHAGVRDVHFLPRVLSHVRDVDQAGVEGEAPRIAQAGGPDLASASAARERVVLRYRVRFRGVHVEPEQLAEQRVRVLRVAVRVAARAAVAHADVQSAVWAEEDMPAVVIGVSRVTDLEDRLLAAGVRGVGGGIGAEPGDMDVALVIGVVHVEPAVLTELWMERDTEQAALAAAADARGDIKIRPGQELSVPHDADPAILLDDEQPRVARGRGEIQRVVEAGDDGHQAQAALRLRGLGLPARADLVAVPAIRPGSGDRGREQECRHDRLHPNTRSQSSHSFCCHSGTMGSVPGNRVQ